MWGKWFPVANVDIWNHQNKHASTQGCDGGRDNRVTGGGRLPPAVVHVTSHTL